MLGAPPAFVLSQDQTLYKWYLSLKSVKSCFAQSAIACVLCELLCLELFNVFSNTKIGSVTSFSILFNFQGPVRLSLAADSLFILPQKRFFVKLFFRCFWTFWTWIILNISVSAGVFERLLVLFKGFRLRFQKSFFCLSAWRSSIIPHPGALVNTFWQVFSMFFANHSGVRKSTRFECPPLRTGHLQRQLLLSLQPAQNGPFTRWAVMTGSRCGPVPDFPI